MNKRIPQINVTNFKSRDCSDIELVGGEVAPKNILSPHKLFPHKED